ncbi:MAG: peroxiredoxin family protein [Kofleriaceae bacterium]
MWCKHQLGELAKNVARFTERGIRLVGVSPDSPEDSRTFATTYGIDYPLLADVDRSVSRAYTGVDASDNTIPGIVVIRRDGTIAFRQISIAKDDRLDSSQLLAVIDRTLGTSGRAARGGYAAISRIQLGIESGAAFGEDVRAFTASLRFAMPLGRFAIAGVRAGYSTLSTIDSAVFAGVRIPIMADAAAIQIAAVGGLAKTTPYAGGQAGVWLAWTPTLGFHLDGAVTTERHVTFTLGISRLISWR